MTMEDRPHDDERKHEYGLLHLVEGIIKEHGNIVSLEPIDKFSIRINFLQKDDDKEWTEELGHILTGYQDAAILAGMAIKTMKEPGDDGLYGFVTLAFNPTFSIPHHMMNIYWLGNDPLKGINFS